MLKSKNVTRAVVGVIIYESLLVIDKRPLSVK